MGDGLARDLCLTGRSMDSETAYSYRLVSEIASRNTLLRWALEVSWQIAEVPIEAVLHIGTELT